MRGMCMPCLQVAIYISTIYKLSSLLFMKNNVKKNTNETGNETVILFMILQSTEFRRLTIKSTVKPLQSNFELTPFT